LKYSAAIRLFAEPCKQTNRTLSSRIAIDPSETRHARVTVENKAREPGSERSRPRTMPTTTPRSITFA
jgi:hypothetical protein